MSRQTSFLDNRGRSPEVRNDRATNLELHSRSSPFHISTVFWPVTLWRLGQCALVNLILRFILMNENSSRVVMQVSPGWLDFLRLLLNSLISNPLKIGQWLQGLVPVSAFSFSMPEYSCCLCHYQSSYKCLEKIAFIFVNTWSFTRQRQKKNLDVYDTVMCGIFVL